MAIYMEVNRTLLEPKCALGSNCARQGHHHRGLISQEIHYNAHEFVQLEIWEKKNRSHQIAWQLNSLESCGIATFFVWSGRKSWSSLKHPEPVVFRSEPTSESRSRIIETSLNNVPEIIFIVLVCSGADQCLTCFADGLQAKPFFEKWIKNVLDAFCLKVHKTGSIRSVQSVLHWDKQMNKTSSSHLSCDRHGTATPSDCISDPPNLNCRMVKSCFMRPDKSGTPTAKKLENTWEHLHTAYGWFQFGRKIEGPTLDLSNFAEVFSQFRLLNGVRKVAIKSIPKSSTSDCMWGHEDATFAQQILMYRFRHLDALNLGWNRAQWLCNKRKTMGQWGPGIRWSRSDHVDHVKYIGKYNPQDCSWNQHLCG